MTASRGIWLDGKVSQRREVSVSCAADAVLRVQGDGVEASAPLAAVRIDPALGTARRLVRFPDGAALEMTDHAFLDALERRQGKGGFFRTVHRWEKSLLRALAALLALLLLGFCFVRYAIPFLAEKAAYALPPQTERLMGRETLQVLDRVILKPSALERTRRGELQALFARMAAEHPEREGWRLEFRSGDAVGANAFALPSGIIVITDRLVQIAGSDDRIAAVLAHEIGHVQRRHALRHLMQNSATALLIATVTGDITSATSLSATLPTVLIDAKYSRRFEEEADDAAVAYLKAKGLPVRLYAEILTRLQEDHDRRLAGKKEESPSRMGELFADHPLTSERVRRVLGK